MIDLSTIPDIKQGQTKLYVILKNYIINQIDTGNLDPGDQLPSEKWFMETFKVSRVTVRKAINDLIEEGVLERAPSKSPVVPYKRLARDFNRLTGLSEQLRGEDHDSHAKLLEFKVIKATAELSEELRVPLKSDVLYIHRVRYSDGEPVAIQKIHLNMKYAQNIIKDDVTNRSLYSVLEDKGVQLDFGKQKVYARMPSREERELLGMDKETPIFYMKRTTYHKNGEVIEYVKSYFNSAKYYFSMRLFR